MSKIIIDKKDLKALKALDPVLSKYIERVSLPERFYAESFFVAVVQTLLGQLISNQAAATIYLRLEKLLDEVSVENFMAANEADIISCGIYKKKYDQIYTIAKSIESGILDFDSLKTLSDQKVIDILCSYPGIGLWSAQMIMLSGLQRKDILAYGDFGIREGIKKIYQLDDLSKEEFLEIKERLSPYGTLASLYFWKAHTEE